MNRVLPIILAFTSLSLVAGNPNDQPSPLAAAKSSPGPGQATDGNNPTLQRPLGHSTAPGAAKATQPPSKEAEAANAPLASRGLRDFTPAPSLTRITCVSATDEDIERFAELEALDALYIGRRLDYAHGISPPCQTEG